MKKNWLRVISLIFFISNFAYPALAFDSGSTGADGAFNPTVNTEIQLPADGKLNFTTVNIPTGVTVTFKKNASNTPVYMLATGDVTIAGSINLNATSASGVAPGKGGTGGFDGGMGAYPNSCGGSGLGPGGGKAGVKVASSMSYGSGGGGGGFGGSGGTGYTPSSASSTGGVGGGYYGNQSLLPIIGGSAGGGGCGANQGSGLAGGGGGGGGAILIASSGTVNISGSITANGGAGGATVAYSGHGGGGSGGAIRIVANLITGNGTISATGGSGDSDTGYDGGNGSGGRVHLEANYLQRTASTSPQYTYLDSPVYVFPPNLPVLKIASIGGAPVPSEPTGKYSTPDIVLPTTVSNPVEVAIEAGNIPVGTTVTVSVVSQLGAPASTSTTLFGTDQLSTATANVTLSAQYVNVVMATATFTVQTAANQMPLYAKGERVVKMRVTSVMGGNSSVIYITESGKEIPADS